MAGTSYCMNDSCVASDNSQNMQMRNIAELTVVEARVGRDRQVDVEILQRRKDSSLDVELIATTKEMSHNHGRDQKCLTCGMIGLPYPLST